MATCSTCPAWLWDVHGTSLFKVLSQLPPSNEQEAARLCWVFNLT